jgi:hypothetical protein
MNNRALFSSVVVALISAGCAVRPPVELLSVEDKAAQAHATVCTTGPCVITVECVKNVASGTPDYYVPPGYKPTMTWNIQTSGYTFRGDGISFKTQDGKNNFDGLNPQPGTTSYSKKNKHASAGSFEYSIYLQGPGGNCDYDPTVFNG